MSAPGRDASVRPDHSTDGAEESGGAFYQADSYLTPTEPVLHPQPFSGTERPTSRRRLRIDGPVTQAAFFDVSELRECRPKGESAVLECGGQRPRLHVPQERGAQWSWRGRECGMDRRAAFSVAKPGGRCRGRV